MNKLHNTQTMLLERRKKVKELKEENEFLQEYILLQDARLDKMREIFDTEIRNA